MKKHSSGTWRGAGRAPDATKRQAPAVREGPASLRADGWARAPLTDKQELFVLEFMKDLNGTQAAIRSGYSRKSARQQAARLLTNAAISGAISKAHGERKERIRIDTDRLEFEAECIATSDVRKLVKEGRLLRLEDIPAALASAIASIEVVTRQRCDGEMERIAKIRFWDKPASLRLLFQLRGKLNFDKNVTLKGELDMTVQAKKDLEKAAMALSNEDLRRVNALYDEIARIVASVALPALSVGQ